MATCSGKFIDDLVLQILCLLPLKCQARFRSVSKQWRSLIPNDPRPVRALLLERLFSMQLLPLESNTTTCSNHQLSFPFHLPRFKLLQSCNGLLLLRRRLGNPRHTTEYHIYNPLTRQHITIPLCTCCLHSSRYVQVTAACLAYEPSRSPHYKLLCLSRFCVMIYSSLTSSWTSWASPSFEPRLKAIVKSHHYTKPPVYWNGSVYYISDHARNDLSRDGSYKLYRFDLDREVMLRTKLPYDGFETGSFKLLVESWGRLYILGALGEEQLEVYEMESDLSGWRLKYHIDDFGRDLKLRFCPSRDYFKIRLCGREMFSIRSDRWQVFFPAAESGGEDELWLVVLGGMLVYRYGLGSKSVGLFKARHHGHRGLNLYWGDIKAHEFAESILEHYLYNRAPSCPGNKRCLIRLFDRCFLLPDHYTLSE